MMRMAFFIYGVTGHLLFLATYAWLAGFVGNLLVPRSIDSPTSDSVPLAVAIDVGLIALFGLQHSIMARPAFKRVWTRIVPQPIERATYVFASCAVTLLLIWQWRAVDLVVWDVRYPAARWLLHGLFAVGWLGVPAVTLMIHHFDLFGTRQVWLYLRGREYTPLPFRTPLLYAKVRHPLYVAWAIAFWATPTMTAGHLLFAAGMTAYMLVAVVFEERDLIAYFGHQYEEYRRRVPMFVPWRGMGSSSPRECSGGVSRPLCRSIRSNLDVGVAGKDESEDVATFDEEFLRGRELAPLRVEHADAVARGADAAAELVTLLTSRKPPASR